MSCGRHLNVLTTWTSWSVEKSLLRGERSCHGDRQQYRESMFPRDRIGWPTPAKLRQKACGPQLQALTGPVPRHRQAGEIECQALPG